MESEALLLFLKENLKLSEEEIGISKHLWKKVTYEKGSYFNQRGDICLQLGFIEKGIFRTYFIDDHAKEHILFLSGKGELVTALRSMTKKIQCTYYIEAIIESSIWVINVDDLENLYEVSKGWERAGRIIAEESFFALLHRMETISFLCARDRYMQFLKEFPELPSHIPQYYIASFLGMENPSLSRLKRGMAANEQD